MDRSAFILDFFKHVDAKEFDWVRTQLAGDCLIADPGFSARGDEAVVAWMSTFIRAFPDMRHRPFHVLADEDKAAFLIEVTGTHTDDLTLAEDNVLAPTGRSLKLTISEFWKFTDGKVSEYRVIYDRTEFLAQLGIFGQPAAT